MIKRGLAGLALLAALAAPSVQGHGAASPREIDTRLLLDDDGLLEYGGCGLAGLAGLPCTPTPEGLDLLTLEVREAWLTGQPALVWRITFHEHMVHDGRSLKLEFQANGTPQVLAVAGGDGTRYTSKDVDRLDGPFPVFDGHSLGVDAWVRYDRMDVQASTELTNIRVVSQHHDADDDLLPGTYMSNGVVAPHVPHDTDPGEALASHEPASYTLRGPAALIEATPPLVAAAGTPTVLLVRNPLTTLAQTVAVRVGNGTAATLTNLTLDAGATRAVELVAPQGTHALDVTVISDLGGHATLSIPVAQPAMNATSTTTSTPEAAGNKTPAIPLPLLVLALLAVLGVRRA